MTTRTSIVVYVEFTPLRRIGRPRSIDRAVDLLERYFMLADLAAEYQFALHRFANTVIWVLPLDSPANLRYAHGHVFHALLNIGWCHARILQCGAMCRGAIAIGDVQYKSQNISGAGITRSQELLSFWPHYPRIVVDPELLQAVAVRPLLRAQDHSARQELGYIRALLQLDNDGGWYVDFLRAVELEVDEHLDYLKVLRDHRDTLREELTDLAGIGAGQHTDDYLRAMLWLAAYYNRTVRADRRLPQSLLVKPVPMLYEFPSFDDKQ